MAFHGGDREIGVPVALLDGDGKKIVEIVVTDAGSEKGELETKPAEEMRVLRAREKAIHITG